MEYILYITQREQKTRGLSFLFFLCFLLFQCSAAIGQSYLGDNKNNLVHVRIKPYMVYARFNFENVGNNDFVHKINVYNTGGPEAKILDCFLAKVPTSPPWWSAALDPVAYSIATAYGDNASRYTQVPGANGWSILDHHFTMTQGVFSISTESYEDDDAPTCEYHGSKDDGHCGSWRDIRLRNYAPNVTHHLKLDCGGYALWVEFEWHPDIKGTNLQRNVCDTISNNIPGFLCSNYCPTKGQYGKLTYSSAHSNPGAVDYDIRYDWRYIIQDHNSVPLDTLLYTGRNNYYNTPDLNSVIANYRYPSYNVIVNLKRYVSYNNNTVGKIDEQEFTITLSAPTPTYNRNDIIIKPPTCNGGKDGEIAIDINKVTSFVLPKAIQVSYKDGAGIVYGTDQNFINGSISKRDTLLSGNNYIVQIGDRTITDINNNTIVGCPLNLNVNVPIRPLLVAQIDTIPYTNTDVSCRNSNDGRILVKVSGGTPPYKATSDTLLPDASWPRFWPVNGEGRHTFTGLSPSAQYNFAVSDTFNCPLNSKRRIDIPYTLTNPDVLRFNYVNLSQYTSDLIYNIPWNISCHGANNGSITAMVEEATAPGTRRFVNPPFRLWITDSTGNIVGDTAITSSTSLSGPPTIFPNLYAGTYMLHVRDNNNCYYSESHTLLEPPALNINIIDFLDNKCAGDAEGMFKTKTLGGTRPYLYYKDNLNQSRGSSASDYYLCHGIGYTTSCRNPDNSYQHDVLPTYDTIATLSNLLFGNHTMFIEDINGCLSSVTRYVNQPSQQSVTLTGKHISCKGADDGTLRATGTGGTTPYSYKWSFDGDTIANTNSIDSLFSGTYHMTMIDANGCPASDYFEIRNPNDSLKATASVSKDPTCADREDAIINIETTGGWNPKSYSLDGVKYQLDEPNFDKLGAGSYGNIHVRDANGCIIKLDTVNIVDPNKLAASELQPSTVSCFGGTDGSILLSIEGGNKPYSAGMGSTLSSLPDSTIQFNNLTPGNYIIHISDSKNCMLDKLVTVVSPEKLQDSLLHVSDASPAQSNGSATIKAFGGTAPYSYQWDNIQQNSFTSPVTMLNLPAGFKRVIITDSKRCVDTTYVGINNIGGPVYVSTNTVPPTCSYSSDGSSTVNFTAATPLTYEWIHGPTGQTLTGLRGGIYYVTVTDANGLISTKVDTVSAPHPIEVLFGSKPSPCFGDCKGELQATVQGGTQPYALQWNDPSSQTSVIASNLCEGIYKLNITDANSCVGSDSTTLINPDPVEINLGDSATICTGQVYTLDAKNPGSDFTWTSNKPNFTASSQTIQITGDGTYYVNVITPYGCSGADTFKLSSSRDLLEALFYVSTKNYAGDTVVFVNVSYPTAENIEWQFDEGALLLNTDSPDQYVIFSEPGFYKVKMTAYLGECSDTLSKTIKIFDPADVDGYNNGKVAASVIRSLNVYPNPNDGSFQAVLELNGEYESELIVHDFTGTVIKKISLDKNSHFETPFNLNQMSKGVYFMRAIAGGETLSVLVTIQ